MNAGLMSYEGSAYPCLNVKAWNGRCLLIFFSVVLGVLKSTPGWPEALGEELRLADAATTALASYLHETECAGRYLSRDEAWKMRKAVETYLSLVQVLALCSLRRKIPRWKCVPKHHMMFHIVEDQCQTLLNARTFHTFVDEDFVGLFKNLVLQVPKEMLEYRCLTRFLLRLRAMP